MDMKFHAAQDLYVTLLITVIVRTFGSFKMVIGDEDAVFARVEDLVAEEWDAVSLFCDSSTIFIKGRVDYG